MYSVVEIKGHQYKVSVGDMIDVEKLDLEEGKMVEFDKVLLVGGDKTIVGAPVVAGAKVVAKVVKQGRTRKLIILKRAPGKYRRKNGHRQHFTGLVITEVNDGMGQSTKIDSTHRNIKYINNEVTK